jgi:2-isopropylmalate synthase
MQVQLYDTTLRDGVGRHGISFSLADKLKIVKKLDELGIQYIEGGWPGGIPKDTEFFKEVRRMRLEHSQVVAFGSTRHPHSKVDEDENLSDLIDAGTSIVTIVAKSGDLQATHVLEVSPEENLTIIAESIKFLKAQGRTVFMDAEHFFDGYKGNPEYALKTVTDGTGGGSNCVILCDTNGGSLAYDVRTTVEAVKKCISPYLWVFMPIMIRKWLWQIL